MPVSQTQFLPIPRWMGVFVLAAATSLVATPTFAQSSSRSFGGRVPGPSNQSTWPGSTTRAPAGSATQGTPVGLSGYCPVCIIDMKKWVRGSAQYQAVYDGKTYRFPNAEIKQTFLANPGKYVPALGGDCTVCLAKMGKRMPGSVFHAAYHKGRLYLFPGDDQKQMFVADPTAFANVDVALNGMCSVCRVEMNKEMPGDPQYAAFHDGMRYLFPGEDQLKMFHANPAKYVPQRGGQPPALGAPQSKAAPLNPTGESVVSALRSVVTVTGTSTCAGCEHGVAPIGAPDELGLGLESKDGMLYVIEEAHQRYPDVYRGRFKKLTVKVRGTIVKADENVRWLDPQELRVLN